MRNKRHRWQQPVFALLVAAWMLAGNHCALVAALAPTPPTADSSCCSTRKSPVQHQDCKTCCGSLNAPLPGIVSAPDAGHFAALAPLAPSFPAFAVTRTAPLLIFSGIHSPPGESFATLIVGTSLCWMAPPVFVS